MMNQIVQQIMNDKRLSSRTIVVSIGSFLGDVGGEPALESGRWERNLFKWILRGINKAARASAELADFLDNNGLNTELSWSEDVRTDFSDFMERFNECNTGKHPYRIVLIIDEFTGFANTLYLKFQAAKMRATWSGPTAGNGRWTLSVSSVKGALYRSWWDMTQ